MVFLSHICIRPFSVQKVVIGGSREFAQKKTWLGFLRRLLSDGMSSERFTRVPGYHQSIEWAEDPTIQGNST